MVLSLARPCESGAYFLPDFLMPWEPVLSGPLPLPTDLASSSRCFFSVYCQYVYPLGACVGGASRAVRVEMSGGDSENWGRVRTSSELVLVGEIVLVQLGLDRLLLLVVNGVGTRCITLSALCLRDIVHDPASLCAEGLALTSLS